MKIKSVKLSYTRVIALGFLLLILIGTFLLMLPISSRSGEWTPFLTAFFTATSAICVTGMVIFDTYAYWSTIGQLLLLLMIQIGGIGFMTILTMFSLVIKRKIGLHERQLMVQTSGMLQLSGAVRLIKRILRGVLIIEGIGVILLSLRFVPNMGWLQGVYHAIFLSVSAFNNAGFDLMGYYSPSSSLAYFANDPLVLLTVAFLVVIGGIGFIVWDDILKHRFNFSKYELHTKIVLVTSSLLVMGSWVLFFLFEQPHSLEGLPLSQQLLMSFFHAANLRTAGFLTFPVERLSESGILLTLILMFIGASTGSTGGGIKVTTFTILILSAFASIRQQRQITVFKRQIDNETVKQASALLVIYMLVVSSVTLVLMAVEPFNLKQAIFGTLSAITTVGITYGATIFQAWQAKLLIIVLMFIGRIGFLTLIIALAGKHVDPPIERVSEKILIG